MLPWDNGEVSGVSAFKADSSGCAVSVSKQGSSSVRYCKKRECGGGRNALVLRQVLCSLIARGAAFTGPVPACRQPSALSAGWAAVTRRETRTSAEQTFAGLQMAHLESKGCEDFTKAWPAWWEPAQLPSVPLAPVCGSRAAPRPGGDQVCCPSEGNSQSGPPQVWGGLHFYTDLSQICIKSCCTTSSTARLFISSESCRSSTLGGGVRAAGEGSEEAGW